MGLTKPLSLIGVWKQTFLPTTRRTDLETVHPKVRHMWRPRLLRATSHTSLKARDHCNLRALIGWKGDDRPSSLHTQRWRSKGPKKNSWMESLHGVLHGRLWIRFHGLLDFSSGLIPKETMTFFFLIFFQLDRFHDKLTVKFHNGLQNRFQDKQIHSNLDNVTPSVSPKSVI